MYERIKQLCAAKGWTIQALEKLAHLSNGAISKWAVSMPKADALYRVAALLDTSVDYLLTGKYKEIIPGQEVPESVAGLLQKAKDDTRYRMMFDLADAATPDDIRATIAFLQTLRGIDE